MEQSDRLVRSCYPKGSIWFTPANLLSRRFDLIRLYGLVVQKGRSDPLVRNCCPDGSIWFTCTDLLFEGVDLISSCKLVVRTGWSDSLVQTCCPKGSIWFARANLFSGRPDSSSRRSVSKQRYGLLVMRASDSSFAETMQTIREMRLVLRRSGRSPFRCTLDKQATIYFYSLLTLIRWSNVTVHYDLLWSL